MEKILGFISRHEQGWFSFWTAYAIFWAGYDLASKEYVSFGIQVLFGLLFANWLRRAVKKRRNVVVRKFNVKITRATAKSL